jgi:20S proteasome alpha/beta subunit
MTVIMAAAFGDGIAIAADTLLHDPASKQRVMNSPKTLLVGGRVGIAQAGTFTGTQDVWRRLEWTDPSAVTPSSVADTILAAAGDIHAAKLARGEESMSVYLVAGYNPDGGQEVYAVEINHGRIYTRP